MVAKSELTHLQVYNHCAVGQGPLYQEYAVHEPCVELTQSS